MSVQVISGFNTYIRIPFMPRHKQFAVYIIHEEGIHATQQSICKNIWAIGYSRRGHTITFSRLFPCMEMPCQY